MIKKRPRMLVVDHDLETVNAVRFLMMNAFDADVRGILDPREALAAVRRFDPHLMTTAISMPGLDGFSLIRKVKSTDHSRLPVIVISALAFPETMERAYQLGVNDYLIKPVDSTALIRKIESLLAQYDPKTFGRARPAETDPAHQQFSEKIKWVHTRGALSKSKRMICIENNAMERVQISACAQIEGYDVTSAMDLLGGLSVIDAATHCDVAVLNHWLPPDNCPDHVRECTRDGAHAGWYLARCIREKFPQCKIYITAEGRTGVPEAHEDLSETVRLILKPLPPHELIRML